MIRNKPQTGIVLIFVPVSWSSTIQQDILIFPRNVDDHSWTIELGTVEKENYWIYPRAIIDHNLSTSRRLVARITYSVFNKKTNELVGEYTNLTDDLDSLFKKQ